MTCPLRMEHAYCGYRSRLDLLERIENATSATFEIVPGKSLLVMHHHLNGVAREGIVSADDLRVMRPLLGC